MKFNKKTYPKVFTIEDTHSLICYNIEHGGIWRAQRLQCTSQLQGLKCHIVGIANQLLDVKRQFSKVECVTKVLESHFGPSNC